MIGGDGIIKADSGEKRSIGEGEPDPFPSSCFLRERGNEKEINNTNVHLISSFTSK